MTLFFYYYKRCSLFINSVKGLIFIFRLYKLLDLWYNIPATQLNMILRLVCILFFGKNACSFFAYLLSVSKVVSQQSELCVFRAQLRAAHFLFALILFSETKNTKKCDTTFDTDFKEDYYATDCFVALFIGKGFIANI